MDPFGFDRTVVSKSLVCCESGRVFEDETEIIIGLEKLITPFYLTDCYGNKKLTTSFTCDQNSIFVGKTIKMGGLRFGRILMSGWNIKGKNGFPYPHLEKNFPKEYGSSHGTCGYVSYHSLVLVWGNDFVMAIETSIGRPYLLQFLVARSEEELKRMVKKRYVYEKDPVFTFDLESSWYSFFKK